MSRASARRCSSPASSATSAAVRASRSWWLHSLCTNAHCARASSSVTRRGGSSSCSPRRSSASRSARWSGRAPVQSWTAWRSMSRSNRSTSSSLTSSRPRSSRRTASAEAYMRAARAAARRYHVAAVRRLAGEIEVLGDVRRLLVDAIGRRLPQPLRGGAVVSPTMDANTPSYTTSRSRAWRNSRSRVPANVECSRSSISSRTRRSVSRGSTWSSGSSPSRTTASSQNTRPITDARWRTVRSDADSASTRACSTPRSVGGRAPRRST